MEQKLIESANFIVWSAKSLLNYLKNFPDGTMVDAEITAAAIARVAQNRLDEGTYSYELAAKHKRNLDALAASIVG